MNDWWLEYHDIPQVEGRSGENYLTFARCYLHTTYYEPAWKARSPEIWAAYMDSPEREAYWLISSLLKQCRNVYKP